MTAVLALILAVVAFAAALVKRPTVWRPAALVICSVAVAAASAALHAWWLTGLSAALAVLGLALHAVLADGKAKEGNNQGRSGADE